MRGGDALVAVEGGRGSCEMRGAFWGLQLLGQFLHLWGLDFRVDVALALLVGLFGCWVTWGGVGLVEGGLGRARGVNVVARHCDGCVKGTTSVQKSQWVCRC